MDEMFENFINIVPSDLQVFVKEVDSYLIDKKYKRTIKPAAKGYLVSYALPFSGKTLLNFVFRKGCVKVRIYAVHIAEYQELLNELPVSTKKEIADALDCKKLTGKTCSPTCPAGYTFIMDGKEYKKCRSLAFLPALSEENNPHIRRMIESEIQLTIGEKTKTE